MLGYPLNPRGTPPKTSWVTLYPLPLSARCQRVLGGCWGFWGEPQGCQGGVWGPRSFGDPQGCWGGSWGDLGGPLYLGGAVPVDHHGQGVIRHVSRPHASGLELEDHLVCGGVWGSKGGSGEPPPVPPNHALVPNTHTHTITPPPHHLMAQDHLETPRCPPPHVHPMYPRKPVPPKSVPPQNPPPPPFSPMAPLRFWKTRE